MSKKSSEKDRKLHVEIMPANWNRLQAYIAEYNADPARTSPRIKTKHVVNWALDLYLSGDRRT